ncbi:2-oxoacid:acceptor oxidoreductase family protein [Chloroflexota bacterium]
MKEIRLHGRGGMGAATGAEMLSACFVFDGKYAASFPMYGASRRGAPITAFCRFDEIPVEAKTQIYTPDCLIIFDPLMKNMPQVYDGLKPGSIVVLNTPESPVKRPHENIKFLGTVDATKIAHEEIGIPATNTCMLGAFAATTQWVSLAAILLALEDYFMADALVRNIRCAERAFKGTSIAEF